MKLMNRTVLALGSFVLITMLGVSICRGAGDGRQLVHEGEKLYKDFELSGADKKYREAFEIFKGSDDKAGMALALEKIGILASDLGDYAAAVHNYAQALNLYSILNEKDARVRVLTATAEAYDDWGDMPGAVHFYEEALDLGPSHADRARIESRLGAVYAVLGDDNVSLSYLKAGKSAAQAASDQVQLESISMQIAEVYRKAGSLYQARATYLEILGTKPPASVATQAQIGLGDLLLASGNTAEAEACYRRANYSIGLGRATLLNGKFDEASKNFQQALAEGQRLNDFELVFAARTGLGLTSVVQGQNSDAEDHLKAAVHALEEVRDLLSVGRKMYFLSGTTHGFSRLGTYEALVAVLAAEGKTAEAFNIAEYTRSRVLTETLSKSSMPEERGQSIPSQPTPSAAFSSDTNRDTSYGSVEIVPFSFLNQYFSGARGDSLEAALFFLLVKMVYLDFDKAEADQALSMGSDLYQKAGFNTGPKETVVSKARALRQNGLQNHLTSLAETGSGK